MPPTQASLVPDVVSHGSRSIALKCGDDYRHAEELSAMIKDATSAVRRIAISGAKIEWIVSQLPHGGLGRWLAEYCPDVDERTVRRWREFTNSLFEAAGAKRTHVSAISLEPHLLLGLPIDELPDDCRSFREKLDEILKGKSFRQLTFAFKQVDENGQPCAGRRRGEKQTPGRKLTPVEQQAAEELAYIEALDGLVKWIQLIETHSMHHTGLRPATVRKYSAQIERCLGKTVELNHRLREQLNLRNT